VTAARAALRIEDRIGGRVREGGDSQGPKGASPSVRVRPTRAALRIEDLLGGRRRRTDEGELRQIALGGEAVDYRLVRAKRRSIGMQIGFTGLTVRASRWVALREIEASLREHAAWIRRQLAEWRARRRDVLPREWKTGAPLLYQGRELVLAVYPARWKEIAADLLNLTVLHPAPEDERQLATFVVHWLKDEALRLLSPRVAAYAARLAIPAPRVRLSNARTEWGSCNRNGDIRLSWRLAQLPPPLAHYVAAHEVAHLVELNHSARFWGLVETLYPGHAAARRALDDWSALLE
jgi:predicted metal-dependent hydrolase